MNVERDLETERATVTSLQEQLEDLQSVGQAKKVVEEELRTLKEESTISGSSLQGRINALEDEIRVTKESNQEMAASLQKQAKIFRMPETPSKLWKMSSPLQTLRTRDWRWV